jgi:hypothetical protein
MRSRGRRQPDGDDGADVEVRRSLIPSRSPDERSDIRDTLRGYLRLLVAGGQR